MYDNYRQEMAKLFYLQDTLQNKHIECMYNKYRQEKGKRFIE